MSKFKVKLGRGQQSLLSAALRFRPSAGLAMGQADARQVLEYLDRVLPPRLDSIRARADSQSRNNLPMELWALLCLQGYLKPPGNQLTNPQLLLGAWAGPKPNDTFNLTWP
jgi:hypothetical protein